MKFFPKCIRAVALTCCLCLFASPAFAGPEVIDFVNSLSKAEISAIDDCAIAREVASETESAGGEVEMMAGENCWGCRAPLFPGYTDGSPPSPPSGSCSYTCGDKDGKANCIATLLAAFGISGDKLAGMCAGSCSSGSCVPEAVKNKIGDGFGWSHTENGNTCTYSYSTDGGTTPKFYATSCGCHDTLIQ